MKYQAVAVAASSLLAFAEAGPYHRSHFVRRVAKREVPQEHSHEIFLNITGEFLNKNNPKQISDPVFGLLGNAAAAKGAGQVTNLDCLKQETADQAFTNAKAEKDIRGMSAALVFAAIERNTATVGATSAPCNETAVNPEIAAIKPHQDPASDNAAATNKAITLELAKQLASIGGDPMLALMSGTFAPGQKTDNTGKGNSCDTQPDDVGCIFTQKLLVLDATPDEITSAVAGVTSTITGGTGELKASDINIDLNSLPVAGGGSASGASNSTASSGSSSSSSDASEDDNSEEDDNSSAAPAVADAAAASNSTGSADSASGTNIQTFTGSLGGTAPPVIQGTGDRPFSVNGNSFTGKGAALGRSCDIQHNKCATAANSGQLSGGVAQCDQQDSQCRSQANLRKRFFKRQATDFGSCSDPTIVFSDKLSDRQGSAFVANNQKDFNHGSAQKIGIIASFICQRLQESCKAPQATVDTCNSAATAATAATEDETAADVFNSKLVGGSAGGSANGTANN